MLDILKRIWNPNWKPKKFPKQPNKVTKENEGQTWAVLWNPQGSTWGEKPVWREGTIQNVGDDGYFELDFGNGVMICRTLKNLKRIK
jgi:hypothetical protein